MVSSLAVWIAFAVGAATVTTALPGSGDTSSVTKATAVYPVSDNSAETAATLTATAPSTIGLDGKAQKICQIFGNTDFETGVTTSNRTFSRHGLYAADLGVAFTWDSRTYFFWGDSWGTESDLRTKRADWEEDPVSYTMDDDPKDCIGMTFLTDLTTGIGTKTFTPYRTPNATRRDGSKLGKGLFEVPTGGFVYQNVMYVVFTTDVDWSTGEAQMLTSVLAKSADGGRSFTEVYELSHHDKATATGGKFAYAYPVTVNNADVPGLPASSGDGILMWATSYVFGPSSVYLAWIPADSIARKSALRYFKGVRRGVPEWSATEESAAPVLGMGSAEDKNVRELSVSWNPYLERWIMLYGGAAFRTATKPWGTWSDEQVLFDPWEDGGYCGFMHGYRQVWCREDDTACIEDPCLDADQSWRCRQEKCDTPATYDYTPVGRDDLDPEDYYWCDDYGGESGSSYLWYACDEEARDRTPEIEGLDRYVFGAAYAPYIIPGYTKGVQDESTDIYFLLSTWNPYNVVLLQATLKKVPLIMPSMTGGR